MKTPSRKSKSIKERKLAAWIFFNKNNSRTSSLPISMKSTKNWEKNFDNLKRFVEENGNYPNHNETLGNWASNQRRKKGSLPEDRLEKLSSLNGWKWETDLDALWDKKYEELKRFCDENGRLPSQGSTQKEEKALAMWIQNQKRKKEKLVGEKSKLTNLINKVK